MIKEILMELIYPSNIYCISCDRPIDKRFPYSLCPDCARKISWANGNCCNMCGKTVDEEENLCRDCKNTERYFDLAFTVTDYDLVERELIHDLKYRDKSYLRKHLATLMVEKLETVKIHFDYIIAVPMHKKRKKERGYNQADLLAREVSNIIKVDYLNEALVRKINTKPLSSMKSSERYDVLKDAFVVGDWVKSMVEGKDVLLIDDIMTTGSTVSSCSRVLKEIGVSHTYILSFASGRQKKDVSDNVIARVCG